MKRLSPEATINLLALAAIVALGAWLVSATEWADVWRRTPPRGDAARDDQYAIKQILTQLGARVTAPDNLDRLPPPGATLVLQSNQWDFVPSRGERLREWVEVHGGHLVLPNFHLTGEDIPWLPIVEGESPEPSPGRDATQDDDEKAPQQPPPRRPREQPFDPALVGPPNQPKLQCPTLPERAAGSGAPPRRFRLCNGEYASRLQPAPGVQASWSIDGAPGAHSLRVPLGKGRVTAIGEYRFLSNQNLFKGDQVQAAAAALDLRAGDVVWFVIDEKREALLLWLSHRAGPALALALLALAFALWRGALRFGPLLPQPAPARRSVAEQIRGTAAFVWRGGGAALLAAARRALDEAARKRFAGWDRMTMAQRIAALQQPTALSVELLTRALDPQLPLRQGRALADKLALIEQARRRLAFNDKNPRGKDADDVAQPR